MDISSLIGFISGIIFIVLSILFTSEFDMGAVVEFIDAPSFLIVVGGTLASAFIANPLNRVLASFSAIKLIFIPPKFDPASAIESIINLSNLARREGLLALEGPSQEMSDPFLKKGIMLLVDGADPELVRSVLETEMSFVENRHNDIKSVWEMMASMFPAWGMVGTMVGLVLMMGNLDDINALGASMAVALLTTFYGGVFSNFLAAPIATKLKSHNADEMLLKEVLIEGMLSIQAGENPRIIEEKLKSFLAPSLRGTAAAE